MSTLWSDAPALARGRYRHVVVRNATVAGTFVWVMVSGFFEPVFYLLLVDVGIGELVGDVTVDGEAIGYATFVAPALLAASAMNGAIYESTLNVFARLRWQHVYDGMLATPLAPRDIALGELVWCQLRGAVYSAAFVVIMVVLGMTQSWWALCALPIAVLVGVAFAACGLAATTFMRTYQDFELVPLVQLPLFLLSATFYPLSAYPAGLQVLVQLTPLYHGVALLRQVTLGNPEWSALLHAGYLAVMAVVGVRIAFRRFDLLLRP
jgi:lipooligosaccharide transport system permease protein